MARPNPRRSGRVSGENGSGGGYIYVKNWRRRQHHKYDSPPWHKVYHSTLHDDDYLRLSHADRGLLHDLWSLASLAGDGRVSADRTFLARQLNVRRVSLDPLIEAGFIEILSTKRVRDESESVTTELSRVENPPYPPQSGGNGSRAEGTNPRARRGDEKRTRLVAKCRQTYIEAIRDGEVHEAITESLDRDYSFDRTIVPEAIASAAIPDLEPGDIPL